MQVALKHRCQQLAFMLQKQELLGTGIPQKYMTHAARPILQRLCLACRPTYNKSALRYRSNRRFTEEMRRLTLYHFT